MTFDWKTDSLIRGEALKWLKKTKNQYPDGIFFSQATAATITVNLKGAEKSEIKLMDWATGIWKPQKMDACLSLRSTDTNTEGYTDRHDEESGVINYEYRKGKNKAKDEVYNDSIRLAMEHRLPTLYFKKTKAKLYEMDVVRIICELPDKSGVAMSKETLDLPSFTNKNGRIILPADKQKYAITRIRPEQPKFRENILKAYGGRCAVCGLREEPLLDAAHIIPISKDGPSEVPNGLSLCQIHHSAYDKNILGIDRKYRIHINQKMLKKADGPMLEHCFKNLHGKEINLPSPSRRPDRDRLGKRFEEFRQAS